MAAALAAMTTATGCGDESEPKVPAGSWAKSVCGAVTPWTAEVGRLQDAARKRITTRSNVELAKTELVRLFGGMELATDAALRKVKSAGVPEVKDGRRIADQFVDALTAARDSFGTGMSAVQRLPTTDQSTFYEGVVAAGREMSRDNVAAGKAFADVSSPELDQAFDQIPECR